MHFQAYLTTLLVSASAASAHAVVGTAYGFAKGVTGGGSAKPAAPADASELAAWLSDDTERVILIDKEYDFTGKTATGKGCDRKSCSASHGGQLYLDDLSCGTADDVATSITYDTAAKDTLKVGSNKSIISSNGKGVLKGKGLSLVDGAKNVIIQGIEFINFNPAVVWGGDALELRGNNDGVWVDHCKFSLTGRMFVVSHYNKVRLTLSNNEFDGVTEASASCNGNHYWTMMFYGNGDQVTLDKNYIHDCSGRAPKLGAHGVKGTFHATNNYFYNMKGHAFDAYEGANALIEGNVFDGVDEPVTKNCAGVSTVYIVADEAAASACSDALGRICSVNSVNSSGDLPASTRNDTLSSFAAASEYLFKPMDASKVAAYVTSHAGPANLGASSPGASNPSPTHGTPKSSPTHSIPKPSATYGTKLSHASQKFKKCLSA